jgi:hypothetical protein
MSLKCKLGFHDWDIHNKYIAPVTHPNAAVEGFRILFFAVFLISGILGLLAFISWGIGETDIPYYWIGCLCIAVSSFLILMQLFGGNVYDKSCLKCKKHVFDYSKREYRLREEKGIAEIREKRKAAVAEDFASARLNALDEYNNRDCNV